jgi:hypothetical protein
LYLAGAVTVRLRLNFIVGVGVTHLIESLLVEEIVETVCVVVRAEIVEK